VLLQEEDKMIDGAQRGFSQAVLTMYSPRRSVIIDMVMVQFISIILTMMLVLFLKGPDMASASVSYYLVGIFFCILMLTSVYSNISR
tara:strand:+ start:1137 stop:1397 length:261 start_codon:yes stop_codon:yes gene_type:complete